MAVGLLGVSAPAAATDTTLYTCPAAFKSVGTVLATNTSSGYIQVFFGVTNSATGSISNSGWFVYGFQLPPDGLPYAFAGVVTSPSSRIIVKFSSGATGAVNFQYHGLEELA